MKNKKIFAGICIMALILSFTAGCGKQTEKQKPIL